MLPKANRLKKKKDFERVFKKGKSCQEKILMFRMIKRSSGSSRFGLVVGKNVSKKANVRNKIRRRLSELIRCRMKRIEGGVDGVFIARPGLEKKEFHDFEEMVDRIFKKMGIFKRA